MPRTIPILVCALLLLAGAPARADVGVVLNEALGSGGDRISATGHSAVYFSRICPETAVKLRFCRPGEQGSVLSTYTGFGESRPYEWNIAPLGVFVYGEANASQWPLVGTQNIKSAIEAAYRKKYLAALCPAECGADQKADWRYMAGAGLSRNVYIFVVETTEEQDRELIEKFNRLPNQNHFNLLTRNCADFTREVINTYFPHAAGKEYLNDFGMSSPKAMARSLTRYAQKHPELKFHVLHFPQLPGTLKRSGTVRDGTEQLYHSILFLVPLAAFADYVLPAALVSYEITGRLDPVKEWQEHPTIEEAEISSRLREAKAEQDREQLAELKRADRQERERVLGTRKVWESYRRQLHARIEQAVESGLLPSPDAVDSILQELEKSGTPRFDARGGLWMDVAEAGHVSRLGLTARNLLSPESDPRLAYRLMLARTDRILRGPKRGRESLLLFRRNWALMEAAAKRNAATLVVLRPPASPPQERPGPPPADDAAGGDDGVAARD